MDAPAPSLTETLANLNITYILAIVAVLTTLRLGLVRLPVPSARPLAEILESGMIAIVLVFLVIRPFVLQAYFIPSPSMEPTLEGNHGVGDRILVNKFSYRLHPPRREDVVVFLAPPAAMEGNPDFIKRLIGRPGDVVQSVRGHVDMNGTEFNHMAVRDALAHAGLFGQDALIASESDLIADHRARFVPGGVLADGVFVPASRLASLMGMPGAAVRVFPGYNIRNSKRLPEPFIAEDPDYDMQIYQGQPLKHLHNPSGLPDEYELSGMAISPAEYARDAAHLPEAIPSGKLLMMGDNRNDSNDGTAWGLLNSWRVVGKAALIFWPLPRIHKVH